MTSGRAARRHALVVLLTVNAGATDAVGLLALGGAFTSVMTGNLVLFGTAVARADGELIGHTAAAICCFVAGCALGARLAGTPTPHQPVWPRQVGRALAVEAVLFAGYAVGWWATGSHPEGTVQLLLLSTNAVALGVQSSSVQRFGVPGLSTTYMTGTLTTLVVRLSSGHRVRDVADSLQLLAGLVGGAVLAALLTEHARAAMPLLQVGLLAVVLAASVPLVRAERPVPVPA